MQASNGLNFMRRRNFFISLPLLCALALSGWSGVLAATLCPYATRAASASVKTDAHSSCHAQSGGMVAQNHNARHQAMGDMEATTRTEGKSPAAAAQAVESCRPCCISHGNLPTAPAGVRDSQPQNGRETKHTASQEVKTMVFPLRFAPAVVSTQGSPPGQLSRRHILLNVFII